MDFLLLEHSVPCQQLNNHLQATAVKIEDLQKFLKMQKSIIEFTFVFFTCVSSYFLPVYFLLVDSSYLFTCEFFTCEFFTCGESPLFTCEFCTYGFFYLWIFLLVDVLLVESPLFTCFLFFCFYTCVSSYFLPVYFLLVSKKFRTGPFEQTPQDLKRAARARATKRGIFSSFWRARARRVLGLEGSVQKVLFEIS